MPQDDKELNSTPAPTLLDMRQQAEARRRSLDAPEAPEPVAPKAFENSPSVRRQKRWQQVVGSLDALAQGTRTPEVTLFTMRQQAEARRRSLDTSEAQETVSPEALKYSRSEMAKGKARSPKPQQSTSPQGPRL